MRTAIIAFFAILVALAPACTVLAETIPLTWRDTGYTLVPGYTVTASLHAEVLNLPFTWDIAKAGVQVGDIMVMTEARRTVSSHVIVELVVREGGEEVYRERVAEFGMGTSMPVDAQVVFEADCSGTLKVRVGGETVATEAIQDNGLAINKFTENRAVGLWSLRSEVHLTRRGSGCGVTTTTTPQLPPEPTDDTSSLSGSVAHALSAATATGITIVIVGLGLLGIYILYCQAKKRKLVR